MKIFIAVFEYVIISITTCLSIALNVTNSKGSICVYKRTPKFIHLNIFMLIYILDKTLDTKSSDKMHSEVEIFNVFQCTLCI